MNLRYGDKTKSFGIDSIREDSVKIATQKSLIFRQLENSMVLMLH